MSDMLCRFPVALDRGTTATLRVPLAHLYAEERVRVFSCSADGGEFQVGLQFLRVESAPRETLLNEVGAIESYREAVRTKEGRTLTSEEAANERAMAKPKLADELEVVNIGEQNIARMVRDAWTARGWRKDIVAVSLIFFAMFCWMLLSMPWGEVKASLGKVFALFGG
jgi:hypothetical protein